MEPSDLEDSGDEYVPGTSEESSVPNMCAAEKVLAPKGQKQIGRLTSAERGQTITVVAAIGASGSYIPPMFIFPRKKMLMPLMNGALPGSTWGLSDSGWINGELFCKWLQHFISILSGVQRKEKSFSYWIITNHI